MAAIKTARDYRLISADSHLTEPGDLWTSRVEKKFVERVPHIVHLDRGAAWVMEGVSDPVPFGHTVCAGNAPEDLRDWMHIDEMRSGGWDPKERINELDADNVDAEVLFPNRPWRSVVANPDPDLHHAMVRAYNDWLSEYCSYAPERLGGCAAVPSRGVAEAVAEIERTAEMDGFVGYLLSSYPHGNTTCPTSTTRCGQPSSRPANPSPFTSCSAMPCRPRFRRRSFRGRRTSTTPRAGCSSSSSAGCSTASRD